MSKQLGEMVVKECRSEEFRDRELIFSGLDSDVAGEIGTSPVFTTISMYLKLLSTELEFSQANLAVFSNAIKTTEETRWFHSSSPLSTFLT